MMHDWVIPAMYGPFHWLAFAVIVALVAYPIGRILRRIGVSPFWSILVFIPILNLLALWILALSDWPKERNKQPDPN